MQGKPARASNLRNGNLDMSIEFRPVALQGVIISPLATNRLKNRCGIATCDHCEFSKEGNVLELYKQIKEMDTSEAGHIFILQEDDCPCGM
jgi:hypothetical protein